MHKQIRQVAVIKVLRGSLATDSVTFAGIVLYSFLLLVSPFLSLVSLGECSPQLCFPLLLEIHFSTHPPVKVLLKPPL